MNSRLFWLVFPWLLASRSLPLKSRAAEILVGKWLEWSRWTTCTERIYCLEGSRQRERQCEEGKRCVGIEEESEDCPKETCLVHQVFPDIAHAGEHSFIQEECLTSTKYHTRGKYAPLLKHNVSKIFPKLKDVIDSSYFNMKITKKKLSSEEDIYKYCFEPTINPTVQELISLISLGHLKLKYVTIYSPLPKPNEENHVTGIVIAVQSSGQLYAVYAQVTTEKGFRTIFYKHMPGSYTNAYTLVWD